MLVYVVHHLRTRTASHCLLLMMALLVCDLFVYNVKAPCIPRIAPAIHAALMRRCWSQNQFDRPSFADVIVELRSGLPGAGQLLHGRERL